MVEYHEIYICYAKDFGCKKVRKERKNKSPIQIHVIGISIVCLCAVPCCGRSNAVLQLCLCVSDLWSWAEVIICQMELTRFLFVLNCSIFFCAAHFIRNTLLRCPLCGMAHVDRRDSWQHAMFLSSFWTIRLFSWICPICTINLRLNRLSKQRCPCPYSTHIQLFVYLLIKDLMLAAG